MTADDEGLRVLISKTQKWLMVKSMLLQLQKSTNSFTYILPSTSCPNKDIQYTWRNCLMIAMIKQTTVILNNILALH